MFLTVLGYCSSKYFVSKYLVHRTVETRRLLKCKRFGVKKKEFSPIESVKSLCILVSNMNIRLKQTN